MTIGVETCLVVAMAFAVFAAITALGSSLVLGIGFERLRAGFEVIKSQSGFFSDAIHKLDNRVDSVEKQNNYFFGELHRLETEMTAPRAPAPAAEEPEVEVAPCVITAQKPAQDIAMQPLSLWDSGNGREVSFH